jgi:Flp pilus assembly protein protease CpaA
MIVLIALVTAFVFACGAYGGALAAAAVCEGITAFPDGPRPSAPPIWALVAAAAALGAVLGARGVAVCELGLLALVVAVLVACWCSDVTCGILPDLFTLAPLAMLLLFAAVRHEWWSIASSLIPALPFAVSAALSKGHAMGWGDVKLVAFGGALLGAPNAIVAFGGACALAAVVPRLRGGRRDEPIAFAPYLVAMIAVSLPLGTAV